MAQAGQVGPHGRAHDHDISAGGHDLVHRGGQQAPLRSRSLGLQDFREGSAGPAGARQLGVESAKPLGKVSVTDAPISLPHHRADCNEGGSSPGARLNFAGLRGAWAGSSSSPAHSRVATIEGPRYCIAVQYCTRGEDCQGCAIASVRAVLYIRPRRTFAHSPNDQTYPMKSPGSCDHYDTTVNHADRDVACQATPYCTHPYSTVTKRLVQRYQLDGERLLTCDGHVSQCQIPPQYRPWTRHASS